MEAEFINEYINRLIAKLHDLTSQNVMIETRLALAEKQNANLQVELQQTKVELEKLQKKTKPASE